VKLQITSLGISGKADAGREKWVELTNWVLMKKPLRSRAGLQGKWSAAGKGFNMAVNRLLVGVSKMLTQTSCRHEDLEGSLEPVGKLPPKSCKLNPRINLIITQLLPDG
jgi:hypothetical protein